MVRCKGSDRIVSAFLAAEAAKLAQKLPDVAKIKTHGFFLLGRSMSLEDRCIVTDLSPFCNPQILEMPEQAEIFHFSKEILKIHPQSIEW